MKTSVIEVHAMLSVLSVDEVEKRIGQVPGVESVTVNYAAGSATVRYDETRLEIADIRSAVRQRAYESAALASDGRTASGAPTAAAAPASPKATAILPVNTGGESAGAAQRDKAVPSAPPFTPSAAAPKPSQTAPTPAGPQPTAAAGEKPREKPASDLS